ncbi:hypothetical protein GCM10020000_83970 [Streptomyces olivoverticillatus]
MPTDSAKSMTGPESSFHKPPGRTPPELTCRHLLAQRPHSDASPKEAAPDTTGYLNVSDLAVTASTRPTNAPR